MQTLVLALMLLPVQHIKAQYSMPEKMNWWYNARFGMFIHFGSYSYLGHGEWAFSTENWSKADYQTKVSPFFNPVNFNAGTIARLAKNAGMKYVVITAKHHEGFSMWNTKVESFKDTFGTKMYSLPQYTAFKDRDILKELKDSCEANGLKFCLYYSIVDWSHASQQICHGANWFTYSVMKKGAKAAYVTDMKAQLKELIDQYHPAVMWFDGDWTYNGGEATDTLWWTKADGIDLYNYLIQLDPKLIVNERVCRSFGLGDFECPEQKVPDTALVRQWETCQTINNSWGYNASDTSHKTVQTLVHEMVKVVSRDGNYLLNIGPKGDGTVQDETVNILAGIGDWMNVYGESIYGATRSPFAKEPAWGFYTKKDGKLYVHVFNWPTNGVVKVPALTNKIQKAYLLNEPKKTLKYKIENNEIQIAVPAIASNTINSVIVINVSGMPMAAK
jgi:alpha-L-fucosidase